MLADLLGLAVCGGIYIVPLYVILQARTPEDRRARTIGANNIVNALFMVASAAVGAGLLAAGLGAEVSLETNGEREQEAMDALLALIADKFGDGE